MPLTVYRATDAGAPVLTRAAGSLIPVLDAVLVNGYGSLAPAGWTKPFAGTNTAAYRMGAGTQRYMRLDDTVADLARFRGYGSMTDVNTGTAEFPTVAQFANGLNFNRSNSAGNLDWIIIADSSRFIMWVAHNATPGANSISASIDCSLYGFGDLTDTSVADTSATFIFGSNSSLLNTNQGAGQVSGINSLANHYLFAPYTGVGSAIATGKSGDLNISGGTSGASGFSYPDPLKGHLALSKVFMHEVNTCVRGRVPFLFFIGHNLFANTAMWYQTITGDVDTPLEGYSFFLVPCWGNGARGVIALQIAGPV